MPQAAPLNHCPDDDDDRIVRIVVLVIIITTVVSIKIIILWRSMRSWHSVQCSLAKLYSAEKAHVREPPKAGSTNKQSAPNTYTYVPNTSASSSSMSSTALAGAAQARLPPCSRCSLICGSTYEFLLLQLPPTTPPCSAEPELQLPWL